MPSDVPEPGDIFTCRQCGDCCKGYGGTYVSRKDIERISAYLQMDPDHFVKTCCSRSGSRYVLSQQENGYCRFWDRNCTIHAVKPNMCNAWPFIASVLIDAGNWLIMAGSCPGIRTDVPDEAVQACVKKVLDGS